jgi:hypothetical protein
MTMVSKMYGNNKLFAPATMASTMQRRAFSSPPPPPPSSKGKCPGTCPSLFTYTDTHVLIHLIKYTKSLTDEENKPLEKEPPALIGFNLLWQIGVFGFFVYGSHTATIIGASMWFNYMPILWGVYILDYAPRQEAIAQALRAMSEDKEELRALREKVRQLEEDKK